MKLNAVCIKFHQIIKKPKNLGFFRSHFPAPRYCPRLWRGHVCRHCTRRTWLSAVSHFFKLF